jgi:hypothetical protein
MMHIVLQSITHTYCHTLVGVTPLRSPENGSLDFSYFIHAQVT